MSVKIDSIHQFAQACQNLSNDDVYDLFEDGITQELRDEIYLTFWTKPDNPEPARSALRQMGYRYSVQSLMDY